MPQQPRACCASGTEPSTARELADDDILVYYRDKRYIADVGRPGLREIPQRDVAVHVAAIETGWRGGPSAFILHHLTRADELLRPSVEFDGYQTLLAVCQRAHSLRRVLRLDLGQGPCFPSSTALRALAVKDLCQTGRVLLLGDDDLVSLALAQLGLAVTVVDIDEQLLRFLAVQAGDNIRRLRLLRYDIFSEQAIPGGGTAGGFDVVMLDPYSECRWLNKWLGCAATYVRSDGHICLLAYRGAELAVEKATAATGLRILDRRMAFSHYFDHHLQYMPDYDSSLYVLRPESGSAKGDANHWNAAAPPDTIFEFTSDFMLPDQTLATSESFESLVRNVNTELHSLNATMVATTVTGKLFEGQIEGDHYWGVVKARHNWLGLSILVIGEDGYPLLPVERAVTETLQPLRVRHGERRRTD